LFVALVLLNGFGVPFVQSATNVAGGAQLKKCLGSPGQYASGFGWGKNTQVSAVWE
jgi:hypothetical protein